MAKRAKIEPGTVFAIDLGSPGYAFGIVAVGNDVAFLDLLQRDIPDVAAIRGHKVVFRTYVAEDGLLSGRWKIIGTTTLPPQLAEIGSYRNQPVGSNNLFMYTGQKITPANYEQVKDLEPLAVWFQPHIEGRLRDYFAGQPNKTFEFINRIKRYDERTGQEIKE